VSTGTLVTAPGVTVKGMAAAPMGVTVPVVAVAPLMKMVNAGLPE
jgi:hypothetical protein